MATQIDSNRSNRTFLVKKNKIFFSKIFLHTLTGFDLFASSDLKANTNLVLFANKPKKRVYHHPIG